MKENPSDREHLVEGQELKFIETTQKWNIEFDLTIKDATPFGDYEVKLTFDQKYPLPPLQESTHFGDEFSIQIKVLSASDQRIEELKTNKKFAAQKKHDSSESNEVTMPQKQYENFRGRPYKSDRTIAVLVGCPTYDAVVQ